MHMFNSHRYMKRNKINILLIHKDHIHQTLKALQQFMENKALTRIEC